MMTKTVRLYDIASLNKERSSLIKDLDIPYAHVELDTSATRYVCSRKERIGRLFFDTGSRL